MSKFKICFIFDKTGDYKPVPYAKLMESGRRRKEFEDKYFLPLNGYLLEVGREEYLDHYKAENRQKYLQREAQRVGEILLSDEQSIQSLYEDVAEQAVSNVMIENLHKAIALLDCDEQRLIRLIYFDEQTERQCAEIFEVPKSTLHKRKNSILKKLKNILEA